MSIERGRQIGRRWHAEEGFGEALAPYAEHRLQGSGWERPALHLEDVSAIPFVNIIPGVEQYQHRARVRAYDGDLFAAVTPVPEGYEAYCRDTLMLSAPGLLKAEPLHSPMAVTLACSEGSAFKELVAWAKRSGPVNLHPYMAISPVWQLAEKLSNESGVDVDVVGPPPPTLWIANDKWSLHRIIEEICGPEWLATTRSVTSKSMAANELGALAKSFRKVGLKRTRCASAMGNRVYDGSSIAELSAAERAVLVERFAQDTEWDGEEELLVVEWIDSVASPSTQVWLPPLGDGDPIVEGVYEQILEGEEQVFVGSRPSTLGHEIDDAITQASLAVSAAFQELGYVGRCSFDFVVRRPGTGAVACFTECNGRWGGTSTPMHLVDRLFDERPHYVAQDWQNDTLIGMTFEELRAALEPDLWTPQNPDGRFILYNVGPLENDGKFDVISLGDTPEEAWEGTQFVLREKLLGG